MVLECEICDQNREQAIRFDCHKIVGYCQPRLGKQVGPLFYYEKPTKIGCNWYPGLVLSFHQRRFRDSQLRCLASVQTVIQSSLGDLVRGWQAFQRSPDNCGDDTVDELELLAAWEYRFHKFITKCNSQHDGVCKAITNNNAHYVRLLNAFYGLCAPVSVREHLSLQMLSE